MLTHYQINIRARVGVLSNIIPLRHICTILELDRVSSNICFRNENVKIVDISQQGRNFFFPLFFLFFFSNPYSFQPSWILIRIISINSICIHLRNDLASVDGIDADPVGSVTHTKQSISRTCVKILYAKLND